MQRFTLLCLILFISTQLISQDYKDCDKALEICKKDLVTYQTSEGPGEEDSGLADACYNEEFNSTWFSFTIEKSGSITFVLTPDNDDVDLDFLVFKDDNNSGCQDKDLVRCMASGESIGVDSERCSGPTGLSEGETDIAEMPGCQDTDNNYLAPLETEEGDVYYLMVTSFTNSSSEYSLEFGGTAELFCESTSTKDELEDRPLFSATYAKELIQIVPNYKLEQITIYDLTGSMVYTTSDRDQQRVIVDASEYTQGLYIINARTETGSYSQKVRVVR